MYTLRQTVRITARWLASFFRSDWKPEDYPIEVRAQSGVPPESAWCARVLNWPGPVGLGNTETEARTNLLNSLREIAASRSESGQSMPRPGTGLPIEFADTTRVNADPDLLEEFIVQVLGFARDDPVFVSDMSSISDFVDDEEEVTRIRNRIQEHFGVEVKEGGRILIADVLDQVRKRRADNDDDRVHGAVAT